MALRDLVEGECGGANSLVRLTSHIVQDRGLKEEGFRHSFPQEGFSGSNTDQLVQQFFEETLSHTTPTFRMDSLLAEMRDLERGMGAGPPVQSAPIAQLAAEHDNSCWADQYLEAGKHFQEINQDTIWGAPQIPAGPSSSSDTFELGFGPNWAKEYLQSTSEQLHLDEPEVNLTDLGVSEEYSSDSTAKDELKSTASEILAKTVDDPQFNYSKFMKFMRQIGEGEVTIKEGEVREVTDDFANSWIQDLEEYQHSFFDDKWKEASKHVGEVHEKGLQNDLSQALANHLRNSSTFDKETENSDFNLNSWTEDYTDFVDFTSTFNVSKITAINFQLTTDYPDIIREKQLTLQVLTISPKEPGQITIIRNRKYKFSEDNPMTDVANALEEGEKRLAAGDIPSAVLCFEAAARSDPGSARIWQLLGITQAQNEQDPQAIAAFKKCLELDPSNLAALMGLAVSYTNENFDQHACRALKDWLKSNPKYSDLVQEDSSLKIGGLSMLTTMDLHKEVCDTFITAARRNPLDIDPDVQCGLGVLFNLTNEQDKAVDCFKSALQVRQNDFTMWNRLGATLANGGRPEEAVDAYHNALRLYPGFIRARYNLGITCTHLGAHRQAVEHLLSALGQQAAGRGMAGERSAAMSDTIWTTLRLVISLLDRPDLVQATNDRDLEKLNREFIGSGDTKS